MVKIDIPYFKEVVVMSYVCDYCGQKNNEVKAGGAIAPQGKRYKLDVLNKADLSRDILKVRSPILSFVPISFIVVRDCRYLDPRD